MKIEKTENGAVKIRGNHLFLLGSIFGIIMAVVGVVLLIKTICNSEFLTEDIAGIVFISIWISVAFGLGFSLLIAATKELVLDDKGILSASLIKKDFLNWSEVKDWGLSYCGQTRGEGNTYYLYFSNKELESKSNDKKKLKGVKIKVYVLEREYTETVAKIVTYCKKHIAAEPFIPEINFHFL